MKEAIMPSKVQRIVKLSGMTLTHDIARTHERNNVAYFLDSEKKFRVANVTENIAELVTAKGNYILNKHQSANRYQGTCNGVKVHFTMKQIVGKLIYWA
jgi:hypothetical protein